MLKIVITGANEGIGYFMTEFFLLNGHSVGVLDLKINHLEPLKAKYGDRLLLWVCDVRDTAQVTESINGIAGAFNTIDIAIHNACRCTFGPMEDTSEATYRDVFDVNYFGAVRLSKAVIPHMQAHQGGRVIFTSSGVGVMGFTDISPYASSKGAMESLAKCLSLEYQKMGITFHILHPPITQTKSSAPFPLPPEFKADPKTVGYGLAKHIHSKHFVICHSLGQKVQTKLCYLFSLKLGRFMSGKMATKIETKDI